jgi:glycerophosphoryl diester phosphodiesterase
VLEFDDERPERVRVVTLSVDGEWRTPRASGGFLRSHRLLLTVQLVAHRGFAREAPENTLAAVEYAAAAGANAVEVDVRAASDGTPVIVHDATVDRVTNGTGAVSEHAPAELDSLSVLGSGEGIPTLDAVLERAHDRELAVNVEVKEADVAESVVDAIHGSGILTTAVWASSFDADALRRVADAIEARAGNDGARIQTAYLVRSRRHDPVGTAVDLGCTAIHPQYRATIPGGLVRRAHDAGLHVNAWTLSSSWVARVVARTGVDGLIADVTLDAYSRT